MRAFPDQPVYLITQADFSAGRSTPEVVTAALEGGTNVVQLREKHASARTQYQIGQRVRELTATADVPLIVNNRIDIAEAINADGVHLGDDDLPVAVAREILGPEAIVGRSVSTPTAAEEAEAAGADYLGVGAVYRTDSKDDVDPENHGIGLDGLAAVVEATSLPVVGIGGVTTDNGSEVIAAGADGLAVISAITNATDPTAAAAALKQAVEEGVQKR